MNQAKNRKQEKGMTQINEKVEWGEWGRTQALTFYKDRLAGVEGAFNTLTNKAYYNMTVNAILFGLVLNVLTTRLDATQLVLQMFNLVGYVFLGGYIVLLILSFLLSFNVIRPRSYYVTYIEDKEFRDRLRYESDPDITDAIIAQTVGEFVSQKKEIKSMSKSVTGAWIIVGLQPIVLILMFLTLI